MKLNSYKVDSLGKLSEINGSLYIIDICRLAKQNQSGPAVSTLTGFIIFNCPPIKKS